MGELVLIEEVGKLREILPLLHREIGLIILLRKRKRGRRREKIICLAIAYFDCYRIEANEFFFVRNEYRTNYLYITYHQSVRMHFNRVDHLSFRDPN